MPQIRRREFLQQAATAAAVAWLAPKTLAARLAALPALDRKYAANDTVTLGRTGIQSSRLAMGTGTVGVEHHSRLLEHRVSLGLGNLRNLLLEDVEYLPPTVHKGRCPCLRRQQIGEKTNHDTLPLSRRR